MGPALYVCGAVSPTGRKGCLTLIDYGRCPQSVIDRIGKTADLVCCLCAFIYSHACVDAVCVHYYVCGCKMGVR